MGSGHVEPSGSSSSLWDRRTGRWSPSTVHQSDLTQNMLIIPSRAKTIQHVLYNDSRYKPWIYCVQYPNSTRSTADTTDYYKVSVCSFINSVMSINQSSSRVLHHQSQHVCSSATYCLLCVVFLWYVWERQRKQTHDTRGGACLVRMSDCVWSWVFSRGPLLSPSWRTKLVSSCTLAMKAFVKQTQTANYFCLWKPCCLLVEGKHIVGVLYQEQTADFSAQGPESSRVCIFFVSVTVKQTSFLFVCLG